MSESVIVTSILQALAARRVFCWRANSGNILIGSGDSKRMIRGAPPGTPDIIGALRGGRLFGLEVKTATGRLSASQVAWAERARSIGVLYAVVRSAKAALLTIDAWQRLESETEEAPGAHPSRR